MRLIDADALGIGNAKREVFNVPEYADGWNSAIKMINEAPTVDAEHVRHGRWVKDNNENILCSKCLHSVLCNFHEDIVFSHYCPNCGAKMDKEENNDA